jgi:hypothetical protein
MSITLSGTLEFKTANDATVLNNQSVCSVSYWFRPEVTGASSGFTQNLVQRVNGNSFSSNWSWSPSLNVWNKNAFNYGGGSWVTSQVTLNLGSIYHIAVVFTQGAQYVYINGALSQFGSVTGNTQSGNVPFEIGFNSNPASTLTSTVGDVAVWNGYALTQSDVFALLFGTATPSTLPTPATYEWTLNGSVGTTPQVGDTALASIPSGLPFATITGSGSRVYSSPLSYSPLATLVDAYVATSGQTIGFTYNSCSSSNTTGGQSIVLGVNTAPTLYKNGVNVGQLQNPLITGYHGMVLFWLPSGVTVSPTDSLAVTAPSGWLLTSDGLAAALTGPYALHNYMGRSAVGTDTLRETFKPGMNFSWNGGVSNDPWWAAKNMRVRCTNFSNATSTPDGYPTTISSSPQLANIASWSGREGLDNTGAPALIGSYAVRWDAADGTTFSYRLWSGSGTITEDTTQRNYGDASGNGQVRVFNLAYTGLPPTLTLNLCLQIDQPGLHPVFTNLACYGPGDFTPTPGAPLSLPAGDLSVSNTILSRFANGLGSIRAVDGQYGGNNGATTASRQEDIRRGTDFNWYGTKRSFAIPLVSARPLDTTVSPWIYGTLFGSPFTATLSQNITTTPTAGTQQTYLFADAMAAPTAATGPVIAGLTLLMPSGERCRVISVTPTAGTAGNVLLERGSDGSTVTTQAAGPVQVLNRLAITAASFGGWRTGELTCSAAHNLDSGNQFKPGNGWPNFVYVDGGSFTFGPSYPIGVYPTSGSTLLFVWNAGSTTNNTLSTTYSLSGLSGAFSVPELSGMPPQFFAHMGSQISGCNLHLNLPYAMNPDGLRTIARIVRDEFPAGRQVWLEIGDEPWNWVVGGTNAYFNLLSKIQYPSGSLYEQYVLQGNIAKQEFISAFNEGGRNRGSEIKLILNTQTNNPGLTAAYLTFAQAQGIAVDAIGITMYVNTDQSNATLAWSWQSTNEQVLDFYSHDLFYNWASSSHNSCNTAIQSLINTYNAATGNNCVMWAYESDCAGALAGTQTATSIAIDGVTTSVPVASSAGMATGEYLVLDTGANQELVQISSISGNTLTVSRGATCLNGNNGLALVPATAIPHGSGANVRSCCGERNDDLVYNPQFRQCTLDFFAFCQKWVKGGNTYSYGMPTGETQQWVVYHWQGQQPGKGDGSDGKSDNRLCLAYPGQPHTKATTTSQDLQNVSVRGQAFLDWMKVMTPVVKKRHFVPRSRYVRQ